MSQSFSEREPGSMNPALDGRKAEAEDVGHLGVRKPFDVVEDQGCAIIRRKGPDGPLDHCSKLQLSRRVFTEAGPVLVINLSATR